jgi:hypothetical protein
MRTDARVSHVFRARVCNRLQRSGRAHHLLCRRQGRCQRRPQRPVGLGLEHGRQAKALSLGQSPIRVADRAQLAGEAELAKAGQRRRWLGWVAAARVGWLGWVAAGRMG